MSAKIVGEKYITKPQIRLGLPHISLRDLAKMPAMLLYRARYGDLRKGDCHACD